MFFMGGKFQCLHQWPNLINPLRNRENMFGRILLPLDGSEVAEMAIPYAKEFAGRLGSEIVLYHVHKQGH
jgi:hypothetical protein